VLDNRIVWKLTVENIDRAVSEIFRTTDNHPWWVPDSGWIETKDLTVGMNVITKDGETLTVADVTETEDRATVYNLTVDGLHTYFVGKQRVLVHNCGGQVQGPVNPGATKDVPDLTGATKTDAEKSITGAGFENKGTSEGGYTTFKHEDGSKVTTKPDGTAVRNAPRTNVQSTTGKKYNPRVDSSGRTTTDHNPSEKLNLE